MSSTSEDALSRRRRLRLVAASLIVAVVAICLVELQPFLRAARLIETMVLFVVVAVCARTARGRLRNALVVICSLLFGIATLEAATLLLDLTQGRPHAQAMTVDSGLAGYRPLLGWGPTAPGVYRTYETRSDGHLVFDTRVTIDDHLDRRTIPSEGPRPIVFFGDSWIFGHGVEDADTLPQLFADLNGGRISGLNLSFNGWSPAQSLIALQRGLYAPLLARPRHFILFAATFQLERTACLGSYAISQAPRFVGDGDGGVAYAGPCGAGTALYAPLLRIARRFAIYDRIAPLFTRPGRAAIETYIDVIEAFVAAARHDDGVATTVLFEPFREAYIKGSGYTEADILAKLRGDGVDVLVDSLPKIADRSLYLIPGDGHPTALANRARAAEIEAHLRRVDPAALETDTDAGEPSASASGRECTRDDRCVSTP